METSVPPSVSAASVDPDAPDVFVGAIDQGTSSTRFMLFDARSVTPILSHQVEFAQIYPQPGWVEHDPLVLLHTVQTCIAAVMTQAAERGITADQVKAIGITNQRETTIVWDRETGVPLHNAIVWLDTRTAATCERVVAETPTLSRDHYRALTGLPVATYFSAVKLRWLLESVPAVRDAAAAGRALFGTVDTWLIWNLTGGVTDGVHVTDVTNASRTMLMSLATRQWDESLCAAFGVPPACLPRIASSAEVYGLVSAGPLAGIPIAGCLGDQQAALVGQRCFKRGDAKSTYGTGCFMLVNTGEQLVQSAHGLLTTVAYQLGPAQPVHYALEGSVAVAGAGLQWLRNNLNLIDSYAEIDVLAGSVPDTGGVHFVPAFSGLFAPHWRDDATGIIIGLSLSTKKNHIVRSMLEAVCFQTKEIIDCVIEDSGLSFNSLKVDGGLTKSNVLLQLQADLSGIEILKPDNAEATALGAAFAAGLAVGVWSTTDGWHNSLSSEKFKSTISADERSARMKVWTKAINRSVGWF